MIINVTKKERERLASGASERVESVELKRFISCSMHNGNCFAAIKCIESPI